MNKSPIPVSELLAAIEIEESHRARLRSANTNKPSQGHWSATIQRSGGSTNINKPSKGQIPAWPQRSRGSTHENGRHHGSDLVASPITDFTPFFPPSSPDDELRTAEAFNNLRGAVRSVIDSGFDTEAEPSRSINRNRPMTRRESREDITSENVLANYHGRMHRVPPVADVDSHGDLRMMRDILAIRASETEPSAINASRPNRGPHWRAGIDQDGGPAYFRQTHRQVQRRLEALLPDRESEPPRDSRFPDRFPKWRPANELGWRPAHESGYPWVFDESSWETYPSLYDERPRAVAPRLVSLHLRLTEPSASEKSAIRTWRRQAKHQVKRRIADFSSASEHSSHLYNRPRSEHQVFQVTELLDLILQFASPYAQVQALLVSSHWHDSAVFAISKSTALLSFLLCAPVEHNQRIDERVAVPLQPSSEELDQFEQHGWYKTGSRYVSKAPRAYCPAKFASAKDLHRRPDRAPRSDDYEYRTWLASSYMTPYGPGRVKRWVDLSQLSINPYLDALFSTGDQIKHHLGRWDITLRPSSSTQTLLLDELLASRGLLDSIGSMHVTNPPCRALGLYYDNDKHVNLSDRAKLLARVKNEDGVRIDEFLRALHHVAGPAREDWLVDAYCLLNHIQRAHQSDDIWTIPGMPTIRVYLDNVDMPDDVDCIGSLTRDDLDFGESVHTTRLDQMEAEPDRRSRARAWISEDLLDPAGSTVSAESRTLQPLPPSHSATDDDSMLELPSCLTVLYPYGTGGCT